MLRKCYFLWLIMPYRGSCFPWTAVERFRYLSHLPLPFGCLVGKIYFYQNFCLVLYRFSIFFLILFFFHQLVSFVIFAESFQTNFLLGHSMKLFLVNVRTLKELKKDYRFCCSEKCFAILQVCIDGKVCHICCQYLKK